MVAYEKMTLPELKALAKKKGITRYSTLTKGRLIARLRKCSGSKKKSPCHMRHRRSDRGVKRGSRGSKAGSAKPKKSTGSKKVKAHAWPMLVGMLQVRCQQGDYSGVKQLTETFSFDRPVISKCYVEAFTQAVTYAKQGEEEEAAQFAHVAKLLKGRYKLSDAEIKQARLSQAASSWW